MQVRTSARDGGGAYLLLDGSRAMTGDLDIGAHMIKTTNLGLKEVSNIPFFHDEQIAVRNRADSAYAQMMIDRSLYFNYADLMIVAQTADVLAVMTRSGGSWKGFRAYDVQTSDGFRTISQSYNMNFKVHTSGGVAQTVMQGVANQATSYIDILQCGDITLLTGKKITVPSLGGAGDRYVYVDNNGELKQGGAYP